MSSQRQAILKYLPPLLVLLGLVWGLVYYNSNQSRGVACSMEAMLCPDGSYVGRSGPNCEFTPCP